MKRYTNYKDSGVEWLGEVPEHWDVGRVGFICAKIGSGKTPLGGSETYAESGVVFLRSQNVYDEGLFLDDAVYITPAVDEEMSGSRVRPGDILLNITGASIARTCLVPSGFTGNVNQHVCILRLKNPALREFAALFLKSAVVKGQIDVIQTGAAREGLNYSQISKLAITLPPGDEQSAIANFLDNEMAKIDALVAEQRRLIELLKEKRQAVISHAVTKGLNPNAKLKPSGIDWLGDVPEHWEVVPLKALCTLLKDGTHLPPPRVDDGVPLLSVRNIIEGKFGLREDDSMISADSYRELCRSFIPQSSDVLLAIVGATLGKTALVPEALGEFHIQRSLAIFRTNATKMIPEFLCLLFQSHEFQSLLWSLVGFSAQPGIYLRTLKEFRLAIPPVKEQESLLRGAHLDLERLGALTAEAEKAISLLQERRTALISAAVTGKIDVRDQAGVKAK